MFGTEAAGGAQNNPLKWDWNNFRFNNNCLNKSK